MEKRTQGFDNLKALLIFLVVLGHVLELCPGWGGVNDRLYRLIYSFHMPAFLYLSGWFARSRPWRPIFRLGYLYLLFQVLYLLFARFALHVTAQPDPTRPYWLLWYLPVLIFCHLLLPGLDAVPSRCRWLVPLGCLGLAVGMGFARGIGYPFALGRFFSFLPYFVLGHYAGHRHGRQVPRPSLTWTVFGSLAAALTAALTCTVLPLPRKVLWGAEGFAVTGAPWEKTPCRCFCSTASSFNSSDTISFFPGPTSSTPWG